MFDIITIGDGTIDNFFLINDEEAKLQCGLKKEHCQLCFNYAEKIPISQAEHSVGGDAANVAVGSSRLGLKTAIITVLGDDLNGAVIKQDLEENHVDTSLIKILPNKESRYSVVLVYQGERTILSTAFNVRHSLPKLPLTNWIYYSSLSGNYESLQDNLIKFIKKNPNTRLAMNPGTRQIENKKMLMKILPHVNVLFLNKEEAQNISQNSAGNISEMIKYFHKLGIKIVTITDGQNGSYASDNKNLHFLPPAPAKPLDKTGAGDAYASGFLSALHHKKDIREAMLWGTANAGSVIQKIGAQKGLLSKNNLKKILPIYTRLKLKQL